jgi:hypothetical protein
MLSTSDTPTSNRKEPQMFKKAFAAIALAGTLTILTASPSLAEETYERRALPGSTITYDQDALATQAFSDIQARLDSDPLLARQVQQAAAAGDSTVASELLSTSRTEVVAVGDAGDTVQPDAVRVIVRVTVCVRVWGTTYCGTVTITLDL